MRPDVPRTFGRIDYRFEQTSKTGCEEAAGRAKYGHCALVVDVV